MENNEAKDILLRLAFNEERIEDCKEFEALRRGAMALEEVQKYQELGTVEAISDLLQSWLVTMNKLRKYESLGTVEEFEFLKEKSV